MAEIHLKYNTGFPWYSNGNIHVKGYCFAGEKLIQAGEEMLGYFRGLQDFSGFRNKVAAANGMFSVIIERGEETWLGVDRMRSFPVFYSKTDQSQEGLLVSDSVDQLISKTGRWSLNKAASDEFLACGYVTGNETLAEGIFQVRAGEALELSSGDPLTVSPRSDSPRPGFRSIASQYSTYRTSASRKEPPVVLEKELEQVSERVFARLKESLMGRTAVIALSGGYDSRYIAAMLKKLDYADVICLTYGRDGNAELPIAREVARKLGFRFIPVIYTDELIEDFMEEDGFHDWVRFSANHCSMFFMQEYFAIRHLKKVGLIPEDSVLIPGHSGDFFGGSQLIKHGLHDGPEKINRTLQRLYDIKYAWHNPGGNIRNSMLERLRGTINEKNIVENALPFSIHEDWDLKEKLAKFLVNSCNIYSFFGYEYRLPLYDYEFQDFFRDIPFELKSGKHLYDRFLRNEVFEELDLNFPDELQPGKKTQKRARYKRIIKKYLPASISSRSVSRQDPIFYYEITRKLQEDLESRSIPVRLRGNSYNSLIVQWYIEYLKAGLKSS